MVTVCSANLLQVKEAIRNDTSPTFGVLRRALSNGGFIVHEVYRDLSRFADYSIPDLLHSPKLEQWLIDEDVSCRIIVNERTDATFSIDHDSRIVDILT